LQIPHISRVFFSLPCPVLHRIAFAVGSKWCQYCADHAPLGIGHDDKRLLTLVYTADGRWVLKHRLEEIIPL
jgi:hypothetical protein